MSGLIDAISLFGLSVKPMGSTSLACLTFYGDKEGESGERVKDDIYRNFYNMLQMSHNLEVFLQGEVRGMRTVVFLKVCCKSTPCLANHVRTIIIIKRFLEQSSSFMFEVE